MYEKKLWRLKRAHDKNNRLWEKRNDIIDTCYDVTKISIDYDDKKFYKVRDHYHTGKYRGAAHNICHLRSVIPKVIPVVFHNGSKFDYYFIIKEFAEESEGQFHSLVDNTEKHITFSVPMKKELDNGETSKYKLKFIDLELCQVHYHVLLIILLKNLIMIDGKIWSLSLTTCQPKMINQFLGVLNAKKDYKKDFNKYLIEKIANT